MRANLVVALTIPSFYGVLGWSISSLLYLSGIVPWEASSNRTNLVIAAGLVAFAFTFMGSMHHYRSEGSIREQAEIHHAGFIWLLHFVGLVGISLYIRAFAHDLGGLGDFRTALLTASYKIRLQAEESTSIGTQISYFGWIAIALSLSTVHRGRVRIALIGASALQFAGNLAFIDRTRPLWILFTSFLLLIYSRGLPSKGYLRGALLAFALTLISILFLVSVWIGKVPDAHTYGTSSLAAPTQNAVLYLTSGFAYLNRILNSAEPIDFIPIRTLAPLFNVLSVLGLAPHAPSQVNEAYFTPFETNVGTVLEPFIRDGGLGYAALGLFIQTFVVDALARRFFALRAPLARYAWATLCFTSAVSFFTPKITTTPVWLFVGLGGFSYLFNQNQLATRAGRLGG